MCGRFRLFTEEENSEIEKIYKSISENIKNEPISIKIGDIYPTDLAPVLIKQNYEEKYHLIKWGFPMNKEKSSLLINARGETLGEKVTFKNLIESKRCLIPASAFYEWKAVGKRKYKYLIKTLDKPFFYMAGLYNTFIDLKGNPYNSFVIITTAANEQMSAIHHRMPLILSEEEEVEQWINSNSSGFNEIKSLIKPYEKGLSILGETISLFD